MRGEFDSSHGGATLRLIAVMLMIGAFMRLGVNGVSHPARWATDA
ncbi:MAG: hypothetical protein ABSG54_00845 [Terriglobia bacterium]|jgi:hypothetical protein